MENESEFSTCGICGKYNDKLLKLNLQEEVLVGKVFRCLSLCYQSRTICTACMQKLYDFKSFLKDIFLNQTRLQTHERKMEDQDQTEHIDRFNCRCSNCQKKFGGLPLLVEVIERNEDKTETANRDEPTPSTSRDLSPSPSRKVLKCTHCEKKFSHKGDYNKHLRKHTGEQPFMCSICDRKFAHTSNLARHLRLHSGDKPFTCEKCNKQFSRKDKLDLHRKGKSCNKTK